MAFALDGSNTGNNSTGTVVVSLTTTGGSGVIVVAIITNAASVTSVTASGLTFTERPGGGFNGAGALVSNWEAPHAANFSGNITVVVASASFTTVSPFGISAAATSSSFDANVSLPATSASGEFSGTTSNASDFVFFNIVTTVANPTAGGAWSLINGSNFQCVAYQIVAATNTFTTSTSGSNGGIMDALKQASGGSSPALKRNASFDGLGASGPFFSNPLARRMLGWRKGLLIPVGA